MKNILTITLLMSAIVLSAQTKKEKMYPFKTAFIEYTYEGNTTGTQQLYIDNYGWKQCKIEETVNKAFGQKTETNKAEITKDFDVYQWDIKTRVGSKMRNTLAENLMNDPKFDPEEFGKKSMDALGFEKKGTETINGKVCEIWKGLAGSSTIWMWNSLAMKSEIKMLGTKTTWIATTVKINEGVPSGKFDLPSDVKFTDAGTTDPLEMMKNQQKGEAADTTTKEKSPIKNLKDLKGLLKKIKTQ
jgi:hypothetical protein